nr:MAG TPA: hypothetical protein [Caudoviricetes sp.]
MKYKNYLSKFSKRVYKSNKKYYNWDVAQKKSCKTQKGVKNGNKTGIP